MVSRSTVGMTLALMRLSGRYGQVGYATAFTTTGHMNFAHFSILRARQATPRLQCEIGRNFSASQKEYVMARYATAKLFVQLAKPLTDADRIALASTALSILRLPSMLQQYSNACNMLDILAGEPCQRAGYILRQAHYVLNAYSGFKPNRHKQVDWKTNEKTRAEVDKLVMDAFAKRRELIAAQEASWLPTKRTRLSLGSSRRAL